VDERRRLFVVCAEASASPSDHRPSDVPKRPTPLDDIWSTYEPILDDVVRRVRYPGRAIDGADLVQQAALIVAEMLRKVSPPPSNPNDASVDELRRRLLRRLREFLRSERRRLGRQVSADDATLDRALRQRNAGSSSRGAPGPDLARAFGTLSPRQRSVIAALYYRDQHVASLAAELGVSQQAVTALHRRALAAMRRELQSGGSATLADDGREPK
jgi:RNA polymerase sigma factor (sigma-70 family)